MSIKSCALIHTYSAKTSVSRITSCLPCEEPVTAMLPVTAEVDVPVAGFVLEPSPPTTVVVLSSIRRVAVVPPAAIVVTGATLSSVVALLGVALLGVALLGVVGLTELVVVVVSLDWQRGPIERFQFTKVGR